MGRNIATYGIINESGYIANVNSMGQLAVESTVNLTVSGQTVISQISGETIISQISGQSVRLTSGYNAVQLYAYDLSGGDLQPLVVNVSGGNLLNVSVTGFSATADVSGQVVNAVIHTSGNPPVAMGGFATTSGAGLLTNTVTKTFYHAYETLPITQASGGTQLLSGNSVNVRLKHIGISGVMYVGSSGTSNFPWCNDTQSGLGYPLTVGQELQIEIDNPDKIYVVVGPANSSGQRLAYMIQNY